MADHGRCSAVPAAGLYEGGDCARRASSVSARGERALAGACFAELRSGWGAQLGLRCARQKISFFPTHFSKHGVGMPAKVVYACRSPTMMDPMSRALGPGSLAQRALNREIPRRVPPVSPGPCIVASCPCKGGVGCR